MKNVQVGYKTENLANVVLDMKSGRNSVYYEIDTLSIIRDEASILWLIIQWTTKTYADTIRVPLDNVDEIHLTQQTQPIEKD